MGGEGFSFSCSLPVLDVLLPLPQDGCLSLVIERAWLCWEFGCGFPRLGDKDKSLGQGLGRRKGLSVNHFIHLSLHSSLFPFIHPLILPLSHPSTPSHLHSPSCPLIHPPIHLLFHHLTHPLPFNKGQQDGSAGKGACHQV